MRDIVGAAETDGGTEALWVGVRVAVPEAVTERVEDAVWEGEGVDVRLLDSDWLSVAVPVGEREGVCVAVRLALAPSDLEAVGGEVGLAVPDADTVAVAVEVSEVVAVDDALNDGDMDGEAAPTRRTALFLQFGVEAG